MKVNKTWHQFVRCMIPVIVFLTFLITSSASAYSYRTVNNKKLIWKDKKATMYISTKSFPSGSVWDKKLQNAMWHWNNIKNCKFKFYYGRDTDGKHSYKNGKNEIYMDNSISGNTLAVTGVRRSGRYIKETDIGFNDVAWNTGLLDYSYLDSPFSFEGAALHELGHAIGLEHEDHCLATMNSQYPAGGTLGQYKEWDPLADDRQGARYLYPGSSSSNYSIERDIAASVFRVDTNSPGEACLVSCTSQVQRGKSTNVMFTFSNLGDITQDFKVGFYLSRDATININDTYLGWSGYWGTAGYTGTYSRSVTIPSWVSTGEYYLGVVVDYRNGISEDNEYNNAVAMPKKIKITSSTAKPIANANENTIKEAKLFPNCPNPFNPETSIEYQLPYSAEVSLTIYNLRGQKVRELMNTAQAAGMHSVQWNGRNESGQLVASGLYLYRIEAMPLESGRQPFVAIRKMSLMK